jgi:hypothetical protein
VVTGFSVLVTLLALPQLSKRRAYGCDKSRVQCNSEDNTDVDAFLLRREKSSGDHVIVHPGPCLEHAK